MAKLRGFWEVVLTLSTGSTVSFKAWKGKVNPREGQETIPNPILDETNHYIYDGVPTLKKRGGTFDFSKIHDVDGDLQDLAWQTDAAGAVGAEIPNGTAVIKFHKAGGVLATPHREWRDLPVRIEPEVEAEEESDTEGSVKLFQLGGGTPSFWKDGTQVT